MPLGLLRSIAFLIGIFVVTTCMAGCETAAVSATIDPFTAAQLASEMRRIEGAGGKFSYPTLAKCMVDRSASDAFVRYRLFYDDKTLLMVEDFIGHESIITVRRSKFGIWPTKMKMYVRSDRDEKYQLLMESNTAGWVREPRISHSYPHSLGENGQRRYYILILVEYSNEDKANYAYGLSFSGERVAID